MKRSILMLGASLAIILSVVIFGVNGAIAQSDPPAPPNLMVDNGRDAGTVVLSWTEAPGVSDYRVGWLAVEDYLGDQENWRENFAYSDVDASSSHTVRRLTPGIEYYFILGRFVSLNDNRLPTEIAWTAWKTFHLNDDPSPCPAEQETPTPTPTTGQAQMFTPPTDGDYDSDDDGLIEVFDLAQLNAIRWDEDGDGEIFNRDDRAEFNNAFPGAVAGMGCPDGDCYGYELVADLDFDTNSNGQADAGDTYWNDGSGWDPIDLNAVFDGGGHTISSLYINRPNRDEVGLFGDPFGSGVVIRNVGLLSIDVTGGNSVGGLVGDGHGITITGSYTTGGVSGAGSVGGLIGNSFDGEVTGSYSTGTVTGNGNYVGGLVGESHTDSISNSYASGNVNGQDAVGGLIGYAFGGSVTASFASGNVNGDATVGGLIGDSHTDSISNSYASGNVNGQDAVGGLIGDAFSGSVTASFASGNVNGDASVGGLIGDGSSNKIAASYATGSVNATGAEIGGLIGNTFETTIIASYAAGDVTGDESVGGLVGNLFEGSVAAGYSTGSVSGNDDVGGLIGLRSLAPTVSASYWDSQTSNQSSSDGGIRQTTAALQSPTGYTGIFAAWDVDVDGDGSMDDPWDFGTSSQYPVLKYGGLDVSDQRNSSTVAASNATPSPDLIIDDLTVSDGSPAANGSFTLNATVLNQGDASSEATTLHYYRSADSTISASDTDVGMDAVPALAASARSDQGPST